MKTVTRTSQKSRRQKLYVLLRVANNFMAAKVPDWSDDDYRHVLKINGAKEVKGRYSAASMSVAEMEKALDHFKAAGFKAKAKKSNGTWRSPRVAKLNAMWCALSDAGCVRNRSEDALQTWCANNVKGLTKLQWATSEQLNTAVEMLKRYSNRCGLNKQPKTPV